MDWSHFWPILNLSGSVSDPDPHSICLLDPDPAADEISSKTKKNSYYLELFEKHFIYSFKF